jgi:uncharacterized protein (DUF1800 family)
MDTKLTWAPFESSASDGWDLNKVAHLHRRAGFGGSWSELQRDLADGPAVSIDRFLRPPVETQQFRQVSDALRQVTGAYQRHSGSADARGAQAWWLFRMTYGPDPLGEKLTLFWHNHFATGLHGVYELKLMLDQNDLLRKHARGKFGDLLGAVEADPAMLRWLDGGRNQKNYPNENFARELLELFTLGTGNYSEQDVREGARSLTGWRPGRDDLLNENAEFVYEDKLADTESKTFLGRIGQWRREDVLRIVLQQPAAADFLCRKLYRWFVSESGEPADELIRPLAAEFRASNYSIEHVVGIILRSQHFFSQTAYWQRVKSPAEFCVGTIRQLQPPRTPHLLALAATNCEEQGQILFDPPSVKGWDGGKAWLNSATALARLNWIVELLTGNEGAAMPAYDAAAWGETNGIKESELIDRFTSLVFQDAINPETRQLAQQLSAAGKSKLPAALQVLLQSPEYQLA